MSDIEDFDPQLAEAIRRRAGTGSNSAASAHAAVLTRAGHIRRRRSAAVGAVAMIGLMVGGFALLPRGGDRTLAPGNTGDVLAPVPSTVVATSIDNGAEIEPGVSGLGAATSTTTIPTATIPTASTTGPASTVGVVGAAPTSSASTATTTPTSGTTPTTTTTGGPNTTVVSNSTSTTAAGQPPIQPFTKTYPSTGGSITVSWNGSALSLLAVAPAEGFQSEIEDNQSLRIRVRFRGDDGDSRIEVRVSNGELIETIS